MTPNEKNEASEEMPRNPDEPSPAEKTAFERFEDFARKVISVPKSEIERRERAYHDQRNKS